MENNESSIKKILNINIVRMTGDFITPKLKSSPITSHDMVNNLFSLFSFLVFSSPFNI